VKNPAPAAPRSQTPARSTPGSERSHCISKRDYRRLSRAGTLTILDSTNHVRLSGSAFRHLVDSGKRRSSLFRLNSRGRVFPLVGALRMLFPTKQGPLPELRRPARKDKSHQGTIKAVVRSRTIPSGDLKIGACCVAGRDCVPRSAQIFDQLARMLSRRAAEEHTVPIESPPAEMQRQGCRPHNAQTGT